MAGEVLFGEQRDRQTDALTPAIVPRPYQLDALEAIKAHRASGEQRGLLTMATGLGKTLVGALDIDAFLDEDPNAKVLFLTHRNEIINQAWGRFGSLLAHRALSYYYLQPNNMPRNLEEKRFVFASFQMMHSGRHQGGDIRSLFARDHFDYVLTDEAHHAAAQTFLPTLKYFDARYSLGLTATPDRADTRNIRHFFGPEIYRKTLPDGIAEGYLAEPHYVGIAPKATVKMIQEGIEKEVETQVDRVTVQEIARDALERIEQAGIKDPKVLVYAGTIEGAELYAEFMPNARAIHSQISPDNRTDMLDDFRVTRPSTLTSVDVLNEGIDVPDVDVIVMARSTGSEAVFLQQLGRGLRLAPGKEGVLILDYVANSDRLLMVARLMAGISKKEDEGKYKPRRRSISTKLDEVIDAPEVELEHATFEFDESILDIIAILKEREALNERISSQTAEKSVEEYLELCDEHGKVLSRYNLIDILGSNHVELLLRPFDGRITDLRRAANILSIESGHNLVTIGALARAYDLPYYWTNLAVIRLSIPVKKAQSSKGAMSRSIDSSYIPAILQYVGKRPIKSKVTTGVPTEVISEVAIAPLEGEVSLSDAIELIAPGTPPRAFALALNELSITQYRRLVVENGVRKTTHTFDGGELGSIEEYLETVPIADYHSKSIEDIARFTETEIATAYRVAGDNGIEGECRRSPSTGIVHVYLNAHDAADLVSYLNYE